MKYLCLLLPLFIIGCALPIVKMDVPGIEKSSSISVKDQRPENEKRGEIFGYLITSSAYGIHRIGDEKLDPPMIQVFRHRVYEKFGVSNPVSELIVHHMVVYYNAKSELRAGALTGVIGAAIASGAKVSVYESLVDRKDFEALAKEEYKRAFYTETENPESATVFVIYIDAEINGKRVFIKTMRPNSAPDGKLPYHHAIDAAIKYFLTHY